MPIYEFNCAHCNKVFEHLHLAGKDSAQPCCPECGGTNLKKLISAPFLPSSVGKPANDELGTCCGTKSPDDKRCTPGSCCAPEKADA
ncbi:MAG: zinc ribbon domain-containing protein [Bacillota bacterium]